MIEIYQAHAERIWRATNDGDTIPPLTAEEPHLTANQAYEIQECLLTLRRRVGERVVAAKLGLTSRAKQLQMGVTEPLYGWLTDAMQIASGDSVDLGRFVQPRIEPEIAFVTSQELSGPGVTVQEVLDSTASVAPALDVLDSRFTGYQFTLADVVADNASAAGFVLGSPLDLRGDLRRVRCSLEKNDEVVYSASGAQAMEHPAEAVAWFVNKLAQRERSLSPGSVVLAGAWTPAIVVSPTDRVRANFDQYGSVELACL